MKNKKKIEKEKKEHAGEYIPVVRAVVILFILILILVGLILYKPTKKEDLQEPNTLPTDEVIVDTNNSCDGKNATRIKSDADKVSVTYEIVDDYFFGYMAEQDEDINGNGVIDEGEIIEDIGYALRIKVANLTENIYVVISNDLDEDVKTFHNSDVGEDGMIKWTEAETLFSRTYDIKVFSSAEKCRSELYREFKVTLPHWNTESDSIACEYTEARNFPECDKFIFSDKDINTELKEFDKKVNDKLKEQQKEKTEDKKTENNEEETAVESYYNKVIDYLKKNIIVAILGVIAIIAILGLVVVKFMKGRK